MEFLFPLMLTVHILVGLGVIGLVLLQHGKGADMGAAFGGGASGSLFGASGSANFLSRTTAILATVFFVTSLGLSYIAGSRPKAPTSVMEAPVKPAPAVPADAKSKIPSDVEQAGTPVPSPTAPEGKATTPTPTGDKMPSGEKSVEGAKSAGSPAEPAAKPDAPASKRDGSASKPAEAEGKKPAARASAPAKSDSKAKEIPK